MVSIDISPDDLDLLSKFVLRLGGYAEGLFDYHDFGFPITSSGKLASGPRRSRQTGSYPNLPERGGLRRMFPREKASGGHIDEPV